MCSAHREVVAHSQKPHGGVQTPPAGRGLKEKYSDSNSSNDFAQNQHADCPWHAEFENHDHFFLGPYPIQYLFMDRFEKKIGHQCVRLIKK